MTMTRETIQPLLDKMTFEVINGEMDKPLAEEIGRALLATMTELEQVKGERDYAVEVADRDHARATAAETALAAMTEREGVLSDMLKKAANRLDWCAGLLHTDTARDQASTWAEETRAALQHKDDTHGPE